MLDKAYLLEAFEVDGVRLGGESQSKNLQGMAASLERFGFAMVRCARGRKGSELCYAHSR